MSFWKNYKTILGSLIVVIPPALSIFGINIPIDISKDFIFVAIFVIGIFAKDFNK